MIRFSADIFNRLSLGIMEKEGCQPEAALERLQDMRLSLICGAEVLTSIPLQAALLTAINTGKRAFLGGVYVSFERDGDCLLPWPGSQTLSTVAAALGGTISAEPHRDCPGICFGLPGDADENLMQVVCNDWQAAVITDGSMKNFASDGISSLAGVFAGGLAVTLSFLKASRIQQDAGDYSVGISLWRPDLPWQHPDAEGPRLSLLPAKYWLLGLGHLGQSYLWSIGLLPYARPDQVQILLQDDDKIEEANWSAGLLTDPASVGRHKTRVCSEWVEARRFQTTLTERRFDEHSLRAGEEPFVALCGFDSAASRRLLEGGGFDLVIEAGLGGSLATFDRINLHTFPDAHQSAAEIWNEKTTAPPEFNATVFDLIKDREEEKCGILPMTIAGKAMSASFVGSCVGALVLAETLRGLHGGIRYDKISLQLRDMGGVRAYPHEKGQYTTELSRNGFLDAAGVASQLLKND